MKFLFAVNPISGGIDKTPFLNAAKALCKRYGLDYEIFFTTGTDDELKLRASLEAYKPDKVVSVGGDGTTLFLGITLMGSGYPMGIVPQGSANGMAVELDVNSNPIEALKDIIMSEVVVGLDLIEVNGQHYSLHLGDVGVNAQMVDAYSKDKNRGMITYAKYFLDKLASAKSIPVKVTANGKTLQRDVLMLSICNARKFGTGVPLNLTGSPMDGKFELVLIENIDGSSLIKAGLSKFNEIFFDYKNGILIETEQALIEFEKPELLQLDGEVIGEFQSLEINIKKGAIRYITTA